MEVILKTHLSVPPAAFLGEQVFELSKGRMSAHQCRAVWYRILAEIVADDRHALVHAHCPDVVDPRRLARLRRKRDSGHVTVYEKHTPELLYSFQINL